MEINILNEIPLITSIPELWINSVDIRTYAVVFDCVSFGFEVNSISHP